jgi:hypothetical protein
MRYRYEYNGNPDYVTLHVTERLIDEKFVCDTVEGGEESSQLRALLLGCVGVIEISLHPYDISAKRGSAFDRDEVLDSLRDTLKAWLSLKGVSEEGWEQLKTIRADISMMQCSACREEQQREMARAMRDFDTLDY